MKLSIPSIQPKILPLFTLGAGGIGMALRLWLLSSRDGKGLLPTFHIADVLCYLVFAAALVVIFLCVRQLPDEGRYSKLFPASIRSAAGCGVGAITIIFTCLYDVIHRTTLSWLALVLGLLAAVSLLLLASCRFRRVRPTVLLFVMPVVYLMLHAVMQARLWSNETQVTVLFFPFLASIFLLLSAYYQAHLAVLQKGLRMCVFFNQAALLLCCICFSGDARLFYMGMAVWMGCDVCVFPRKTPRQQEA